jgi:hypothetical protein
MSTKNSLAKLQLQLDNAREQINKAIDNQQSIDESNKINSLVRGVLMDSIDRFEACVRLIDGTDEPEETSHDAMRVQLWRLIEDEQIYMKDIARGMGLSPNTVWNFLREQRGERLPGTVAKIEKYLRDNGYDI